MLGLLVPNAALSHIELARSCLVFFGEPGRDRLIDIHAEGVESYVALGVRQPHKGHWLLRIAVVARRVDGVRYVPTDASILNPFFESRVDIRPDDLSNLAHHFAPNGVFDRGNVVVGGHTFIVSVMSG